MSNNLFTNIKVWPLKNQATNIKANGSMLVAGTVEVKFTIIQGQKGPFASIPSRKYKDKEGKDKYNRHYNFPNDDVWQGFQKAAVAEFKKAMGAGQGSNANAGEHNQDTYNDEIPW